MPSSKAWTYLQLYEIWGTVIDIAPSRIKIAGVRGLANVGAQVTVEGAHEAIHGEVLGVGESEATALIFGNCSPIRIGDRVWIEPVHTVKPSDAWLGQVINYLGEPLDSARGLSRAPTGGRDLLGSPPPAHLRRGLGERMRTGWMVTDTLLPICRGQRVGLFAGSGVGKSTFLSALAAGLEAERVVVGLIGERSREVNDFVRKLPKEVAARTVVVAATSSESPGAKKRAAACAVTAAEHFRDEGHHVLLLIDSITRFAEAHREVALMTGEAPALHAYPPSTVRVISELAERTGPGAGQAGDITAVFAVLVAGSDLEEPVADMLRGVLDGHIVLAREIAHRGRYPAIDVLRSVSRSLPNAASQEQNALLLEYRRMIALYDQVAPMLRANLFEFGKDPEADKAIELYPSLDAFVAQKNEGDIGDAFLQLNALLSEGRPKES